MRAKHKPKSSNNKISNVIILSESLNNSHFSSKLTDILQNHLNFRKKYMKFLHNVQ